MSELLDRLIQQSRQRHIENERWRPVVELYEDEVDEFIEQMLPTLVVSTTPRSLRSELLSGAARFAGCPIRVIPRAVPSEEIRRDADEFVKALEVLR